MRLGDVQSDTTDNPVATVTADLGAGDCLLDCRPVLLNFGSLHDQIYSPGHEKKTRSVFWSVSGPFRVLVTSPVVRCTMYIM